MFGGGNTMIPGALMVRFFNRLLTPTQKRTMRRHHRRTVALHWGPRRLVCIVDRDGTLSAASRWIDADATVRFSPPAPPHLSGDGDLLRDFSAVRPTLEQVLELFLGDEAAAGADSLQQAAAGIAQKLLSPLAMQGRNSMDDFYQGVRDLQTRVAALRRRLENDNAR